MTDGARTPSGRFVCFTAPRRGAGTTSVAVNLALAWAGLQERNVILVQAGPAGGCDAARLLRLEPPPLSRLRSGDRSRGLSLGVPISQWGVGAVPAAAPGERSPAPPAEALAALDALAEHHDIFLDVPPGSPWRRTALELAGVGFRVCLPLAEDLVAPPPRFETVVNAFGGPGLDPSGIVRRLGTRPHFLPWEPRLAAWTRRRRPLALEDPASPWCEALRPLLGRVLDTPPGRAY